MNTRYIAEEYRLSHWSAIMQERQESGLSVKAFCERSGFHENRYYYWQKKLREAACGELVNLQSGTKSLAPAGFAEVKLAAQVTLPTEIGASQSHVCVEGAGVRITASGDYPAEKLALLLREVAQHA